MKKIIIGLYLLMFGTYAGAQGLEGIVVEKYYVSNATDATGSSANGGGVLPAGSITWRFYADMLPGYKLQAVYGVDVAPTNVISAGDHELRLQTTTTFFNNEDRGATTATYTKAQTSLNSVMLDSWFSVGGACTGFFGIQKTLDNGVSNTVNSNSMLQNNAPSAGIPLTTQDGLFAGSPEAVSFVGLTAPQLAIFNATSQAGSLLATYNASWASLNGATGPDASNKVLIAQITTDGVLTYNFNIQLGTPSNGVERFVASSPAGAEIVNATLSGVLNAPNPCPTVSITSPANNAAFFVNDIVPINATAFDSNGTVSSVQFFVNGISVGTDNAAPFTVNYTATLGTKTLTAVATDNDGCGTTSSALTITVGTNTPPVVSITSPSNGANLVQGASVALNATASDPDGTVSQVQFLVDNIAVGTDATSPYSFSWTAVIGTHTITAIATDNNSAVTTSSAVVVNVISSSASYTVTSSSVACDVSNICLPISAIVAVNDVVGYDVVIAFDNTKVQPSGLITVQNNLVNPSFVSNAYSIDLANGLMNISLFFNGTAPANAEFNGIGNVFCVEFVRLAGFTANDVAAFTVPTLQESYITGVQQKVIAGGQITSTQNSSFTSNITFWSNGAALGYSGAGVVTEIKGDSLCANLSATAVQPNSAGQFSYNLANGPAVNIQRDILNTTTIQPVVNGFDAFLTRRLLINDATFIPSAYQLIAMDVNLDGVISAGDLSQINQRAVLILGEYKQDWNYNSSGTSLGPLSKDWLYVPQSTLNLPAYFISSTFPGNDGIGFSKARVPNIPFCHTVPVIAAAGGCKSIEQESYSGILLGDVNGNFSTVGAGTSFKTESNDKVIFDLSNATFSNGYVDVPVQISSTENVNSIDLATKFDESKLTYVSVASSETNLSVLQNLEPTDRTLRVTSNSLTAIGNNQSLFTVRFTTIANEITAADFNSTEAYINGELVNFELNTASAITSKNSEVTLSVYPNPAQNVLNVKVSENATAQLMDISGKQVFVQTKVNANEKLEINTESLASGVYMLKVYNHHFVTVKRVVVSK